MTPSANVMPATCPMRITRCSWPGTGPGWPRSRRSWPPWGRSYSPSAEAASPDGAPAAPDGAPASPDAAPRRRYGTWSRVGIVVACLFIVAGAVILVDHAVSPAAPGQAPSGSVTVSKEQQIEDQLAAAAVLTDDGEGQQALELYNKVLTEDPDDPIALAAGGWLEWNAGVAGKSAAAEQAGRQSEEKAVRVGPSFYGGHLYLGLILLDQDDNAPGAVTQFTKFLADGPSKAEMTSVASQIAPAWTQLHEPLPAALARRDNIDHHIDVSPVARAARPPPRRRRRRMPRRPPRWSTSRPRRAANDWRRRPSPRVPVRARCSPTSRRSPSAPPRRPGPTRSAPARLRPRAPRGTEVTATAARADRGRRRRRPRPTWRTRESMAMWPRARSASLWRRRASSAPSAAAAAPKATRAGIASSPAASRPLLLAPDDEGLEPAPASDDERAGAGNASDFVGAETDEVGAQLGQVDRHVAAGRRRVDVHRHAGGPAEVDDLVHRLQRPHLVVGPLAVHQRRAGEGLRRQPGLERAGVEAGRHVDGNDLDRRQPRWTRRVRPSARRRRRAPGRPGAGGSLPRRRR